MSRVHHFRRRSTRCNTDRSETAAPIAKASQTATRNSMACQENQSRDGPRGKRQRGSVLIFTLISFLTLVTFMMFFVSVGQGYLAQNQLQISADAVARAALGMVSEGRSEFISQIISRRIPRDVQALERGEAIPNSSIVFGDWNYQASEFRPGGREFAAAVQVDIAFSSSSPQGPIDLIFAGLLPSQTMEIAARGIAATSCREFVFVLDVSKGMIDEIDRALEIVAGFVDALDSRSLSGDKIGMVVYAGDAMSIDDYARDGGAFWGQPVPGPLIPIPAQRDDIEDWLAALEFEANIVCDPDPRQPMPTRGRGSCLGKGDQVGIERAIRLFEESAESCSAPGERVIILITSDTPCFYWGGLVNDFFKFYGGSFSQAYQAANDAWAAGISIAPVLIDRGDLENCGFKGAQLFQHKDSPEAYIDKMARGFVSEGLIDPTQAEIDDLIGQLTQLIPVRIVN